MHVRMLARCCVFGVIAVLGCRPAVDTSWHDEGAFRWRTLDVPTRGRTGFTPLDAKATGLRHANTVKDENALANRHLIIGAGVAAADVDADGLTDLFVASVELPSVLYRNMGDMKFVDVTSASGVALTGRAATGATFADVDGDGDSDLLVGTLGGPICLFQNDGKGKFVDVTGSSGLDSGFAATTMTLADVEGDGDLDLYVATYKVRNALDAYPPQARAFDQVVRKIGTRYEVRPEWAREYRVEDRPDLGGIVRSQRAERDLFYLNDGRGHFVAQPTSGERWRDEDGRAQGEAPDHFSLAARFYDVNGDRAPDLYVCNDFEDPDQFWLNDGRGGFRLVPRLAVRATSNTCMSVDFGDVNRDGAVDFFTADMLSPTLAARQRQIPTHTPLRKTIGESADRAQWMRNTLQLSRGDGTWAQIADFAGVAATDWTWGSAFADVDLDGYEDLLLAVGHRWDVRDADTFDRIRNAFPRVPWNREQGEFPRLAVPSMAFRNRGDLTFEKTGAAWRFGTDSAITHGIALADLDGDGDHDVVTTRLNEPPVVYRNESVASRLLVRLSGTAPNTAGVGALVTVRAPGLPVQSREITSGGSYLSGHEATLVFAAPRDSAMDIDVRWRNGTQTRVTDARGNRMYEVRQRASGPAVASGVAAPESTAALFADATALLGGHEHRETLFDDFARQPLLPNRFSQLGPGVTWMDVDADGRDDLVLPSGKGGGLSVLRQAGGRFLRVDAPLTQGDLGTVIPWPSAAASAVLASQSSYEASSLADGVLVPTVVAVEVRGGRPTAVRAAAPGDSIAVGPMAAGDVDGDGRLDLFVGSRVRPGAWPIPARSVLYRGMPDGALEHDDRQDRAMASLGLVTAATFADLNGDSRPDLIVASEWGPIRVLLNQGGQLVDVTQGAGLSGISSRWMGVTTIDADEDGALDIVATSWGRNVPWRATAARPHVLLVGRFGESLGLLSAQQDSATGRELPLESLSRLGVALPFVRERIPSYAAFAAADVDSVFGPPVKAAVRVGATTFDHTLYLNRGGRFEARPLPAFAQLAPSAGPVVADFDGDGHEDLFLAQNFFPTEISTLRFDAGVGLILQGDGSAGFRPLGVRESGVSIPGDQRGAAVADYDGDGRPDLAVAQNGWQTRLLRNQRARPGLRVRLVGTDGNPSGIGAQLRVVSGARRGPVREVHAGTGYWSVNSAVSVLALPDDVTGLWVRWPNGKERVVDVAKGQREVVVRVGGE